MHRLPESFTFTYQVRDRNYRLVSGSMTIGGRSEAELAAALEQWLKECHYRRSTLKLETCFYRRKNAAGDVVLGGHYQPFPIYALYQGWCRVRPVMLRVVA